MAANRRWERRLSRLVFDIRLLGTAICASPSQVSVFRSFLRKLPAFQLSQGFPPGVNNTFPRPTHLIHRHLDTRTPGAAQRHRRHAGHHLVIAGISMGITSVFRTVQYSWSLEKLSSRGNTGIPRLQQGLWGRLTDSPEGLMAPGRDKSTETKPVVGITRSRQATRSNS